MQDKTSHRSGKKIDSSLPTLLRQGMGNIAGMYAMGKIRSQRMNTQANLFEGRKRKDSGMKRAAENRSIELSQAQWAAKVLAETYKTPITVDDVRRHYSETMKLPWTLGNAAGSIFKSPEWECVGFVEASHPEAHGRIIRRWRLK